MRITILGAVGMLEEDRLCVPALPKVRQLFALLLSKYNYTVGTQTCIDELWNEDPPRSVKTTLQTYIYHLRKWLNGYQSAELILVSRPNGYALVGADDQLDAKIFERLRTEGRALLDEGKSVESGRKLRESLLLWRGAPFANVTHGRLLESRVVCLEELRVEALQLRMLTDVRLNRHCELIPLLQEAVSDYPLNEWFYGLLMYSLNESGRRVEALRIYQTLRRLLITELGLEPSNGLQRMHQQILSVDHNFDGALPHFVTTRRVS